MAEDKDKAGTSDAQAPKRRRRGRPVGSRSRKTAGSGIVIVIPGRGRGKTFIYCADRADAQKRFAKLAAGDINLKKVRLFEERSVSMKMVPVI